MTANDQRTRRPGTGRCRNAAVAASLVLTALGAPSVPAPAWGQVASVGQGFTVTRADLAFVLQQIKIAERHAATLTADAPCSTLVGPEPNQLSSRIAALGLRTVDGSCNNLFGGRENFAAANQVFPRLTSARLRDADLSPASFGPPTATSYRQVSGAVFDSSPRVISNLVSDQTSANPAAVAASGHPARTRDQAGYTVCVTDPDPVAETSGSPAGCVPTGTTMPIPNVSTDVGLSPPFNGVFTLFGQFFDHGIDQTVKGGGTVFVPLSETDPLVAGPDGRTGTADDLPVTERFMVLSRARPLPGPDGVIGTADDRHDALNTDTPWVDLSQTYSSHASHQVFLREYALASGVPIETGRLLEGNTSGVTSGLPTWAAVKRQAAELLGLRLRDSDVLDIPLLAVDPYGNFLPGPRGLPQYVTRSGLVEGDLAAPVAPPADSLHFDTPFLTDIAHNADPSPQDLDHDPSTPRSDPAPDPDTSASRGLAGQPAGTYDDELLDAHYVAGDGRVNENIGLTAIHHVFASEHNRLVRDIDGILRADTSVKGLAASADWHSTDGPAGWDYGQRLFQAARFITEMEYQHIVFEEFVRTIQPGLAPFSSYHPELRPDVPAEFAHAVYRFGHSMLTDVMTRTSPGGAKYNLPLVDAFLDPQGFARGRGGETLSPAAAAGSLLQGMSQQVGSEIDEFVTETLRNNLLGLPLDLATLNVARGRSEAVPPFNQFRRELYGSTQDARLKPYRSWSDLAQHLKHPETLVNLVAAYGTHPTVRDSGPDGELGTADDVRTVGGKRAAAEALLNPPDGTAPVEDAVDFVEATGTWATRPTGLDDVDLWVGGLAEATPPFGGLLGSTFDYVFEQTLAALQDGDRFYYLARLAGLNLLAQVEGGSFAELIQRNTQNTSGLKANVFAVTDCHFLLAHLDGTPAGYAAMGQSVADDPATDCDEHALLIRSPDGTLSYRATNSVDPAGLNAQSVFEGSETTDRVVGGNDNDTLWGNDGDDQLEGGSGDDVALGGAGNDVITDSFGLDVLKGGPGNDALNAGPGIDTLLGGDGQDLTNGGSGDNETFAGPGDDLAILGTGNDTFFGGGGSDWAEGGQGADTLNGDHGGLLPGTSGDLPAGHDVLLGGSGDSAYDGEAGDDILGAGPSLERFIGGAGYDWVTHQFDAGGAVDDMLVNGAVPDGVGAVVPFRDRWLEVEALSGSAYDDILRGDDTVPRLVVAPGLAGCDVLDQDGVDRIQGLGALLPVPAFDLGPVAAASITGDCPLSGPVWGEGNILLGGGGSDVIEGRGGDDVIDGDRMLSVRISVRSDPRDASTEIGTATSLTQPYRTGSSVTIQQAVFDGTLSPDQLVLVRELVVAGDGGTDTAVYFGARSDYTVETRDGFVIVTQTSPLLKALGQKVTDGRDILRNIERLQFSDAVVVTATPDAPTVTSVVPGSDFVTLTWAAAPRGERVADTGSDIEVIADGQVVRTITGLASSTTTYHVGGLVPGTSYSFRVRTLNSFGPGAWSAPTPAAVPVATAPQAPSLVLGTPGDGQVALTWAPGSDGGAAVEGWSIQVLLDAAVVGTRDVSGPAPQATVTGLTNGGAYTFRVQARNALGVSAWSEPSAVVTPGAAPPAPKIGRPSRGARGGALTAIVKWSAARSSPGAPITGFRVLTYRVLSGGGTEYRDTRQVPESARSLEVTLPSGQYRFRVVAYNGIGESAPSALSAAVSPR